MTNHHTNYTKNAQAPLFPATGRAAIYARVATKAQTQTTQPKSNDLLALAQERGYSTEQVTIFEDTFVAHTTPLLKREALAALLQQITGVEPEQEPIRVVFVASEGRLFRDANSKDIALFMQTCSRHGVLLVTPTMTYDFTIPAHGTQFRFKCEEATLYIAQQVSSRLQSGKQQKKQKNG